MSQLSDLLSKIKQSDLKKEIPPGLSDTITSLKKKESGRRRILFFSILIGASLSLGLAAAYFADYINSRPLRPSETTASIPDTLPKPEKSQEPSAPIQNQQKNPPLPDGKLDSVKSSALTDERTSRKESPEHAAADSSQEEIVDLSRDAATEPENSKSIEQVTNLIYLARNYEKSGEHLKAAEVYRKVLQIDPDNYKIMNNIATLMIRMNMHDESMKYLLETMKLDASYVPALVNLGIVYAGTGRFPESEKSLLKAISLEENNRLALINLAVLYEKEGLDERAREYYQKLRNLGDSAGTDGLKRLDNR